MNTYRYIIVQQLNDTWNYAHTDNTQISTLNWQKINSITALKNKIITETEGQEPLVITIPQTEIITNSTYNQLILITKGTKELFSNLFPNQVNQFCEIDEEINIHGEIRKPLSEPEINKALRTIFRYRAKEVIFLLSNTAFNPLHQSNIKNVLHTAGVKSVITPLDLRD